MIGLLSGLIVGIEDTLLVVMVPSYPHTQEKAAPAEPHRTDEPTAKTHTANGVDADNTNMRAQNFFGIGYRVEVTRSMCAQARIGAPITIHTRLNIKSDNTIELIGFVDEPTAKLYEGLTMVQGVGRSLALALLEHRGYEGTIRAITSKDTASLTAVKGLGAKIATRLVNELSQHRIILALSASPAAAHHPPSISVTADVVEALVALGFDESAASTAAQQNHLETQSGSHQERVESLLKKCLQILSQPRTKQ